MHCARYFVDAERNTAASPPLNALAGVSEMKHSPQLLIHASSANLLKQLLERGWQRWEHILRRNPFARERGYATALMTGSQIERWKCTTSTCL
jgi:hypothetical protein